MLDDVWQRRDFPVLREVARRLDVDPRSRVTSQEVIAATGLSKEDINRAGKWLSQAGYVKADDRMGLIAGFIGVSPEARRLVGLWPSPESAADRLIAALDTAVEQAHTPEEKSRRVKVRDGFVASGRDFAVSVAAGVLTGQLGG